MTTPAPTIGSTQWSGRAWACIEKLQIKTFEQLAALKGDTLAKLDNVSKGVIREFARACIAANVFPSFVRGPSIMLNFWPLPPVDYKHLSGPYGKADRWQLEIAIAQLGSIPWVVVADENGDGINLYRDERGWRLVEPE